jgi:N-acetylneuraminic acid mutarotase
MKALNTIFILFLLAIFLISCDKNEVTSREYPRLNTLDATDISDSGTTFNAEIIYRGDLEIIKYGFVWSEKENPSLENSDKIVFSDNIQSNKFTSVITTTLKRGVYYNVRSFIITNNYTVYGNCLKFLSLGSKAPKIFSFSPKTGTWGDTIKIIGNNFSYLINSNTVQMGEITSKVISASDTILIFQIPAIKNSNIVKLKVSISGNTSTSVEFFNYLIPKIAKVEPLSGTFNDTLTITGENFGRIGEYNSVFLGDVNLKIVSVSPSIIRAIVPERITIEESLIKIISSGNDLLYNQKFRLNSPVISSFEPATFTHPNEIITIKGTNFNPTGVNNSIQIGGYNAKVLESSGNILKVQLPDEIIQVYNISLFSDVSLSITVAQQSYLFSNDIKIFWQSTWTKKNDFPGFARHNAVAFSLNGRGYFGTGLTKNDFKLLNDFWEYDPTSDKWTQIDNYPGKSRAGSVSFVIRDEGYVGIGSENFYWNSPEKDKNHFTDFYKYNSFDKKWTQITDFKGIGRHSSASFSINNFGYVTTGYWGLDGPTNGLTTNDSWKYDPLTNQWTKITNFPAESDMAVGFNIGDVGYVYNYNYLYKYSNNRWNLLSSTDFELWENVAFSIGNLGYYGMGTSHHGGTNALWEYNPVTNSIVNRALSNQVIRWGASVFVINNKAYLIGGATDVNNGIDVLNDVWEFDPTKPAL